MMLPRAALLSAAFVASFVAATPARAAGAADQAAAEVLFNEAKTLMNAGDHARACPKFVESQRLDPTVGTLLNIGNCYEKAGKLASAWGAFKAAEMTARNAGDTGRQGEAARRGEALAPRLAKLTIAVAAPIAGLQVRRDGDLVGEGQWGSALPVDVGEHEIEVTAPGRKKWTAKVQVAAQGASVTVNVPELAPEVGGAAMAAGGSWWTGQRIAGVSLGGVGVVGMIVGAVFAAKAAGKNSDSLPHCLPSDEVKCDATGVALRNEAFDAAQISNVTFIAGGILAASGLMVILTAPSTPTRKDAPSARVQPMIGAGFAGLTLQGAW